MNELICKYCGGRLVIDTEYDGKNELAEDYHPERSKWWGYVLNLTCIGCSTVYPIARMRTFDCISRIIRKEGDNG